MSDAFELITVSFPKMSTHYLPPISYIPNKLLDMAGLPIKIRWALLTHSSQVAHGP